MTEIFSINKVFDFEKKCLDVSKELLNWLEEQRKLLSSTDSIGQRLSLFYCQHIKSFINNSEFIASALEGAREKENNLEALRNIIRTVIELLCHAIYLNKISKEEKIKKAMYIDTLITILFGGDDKTSNYLFEEHKRIAESLKISLPSKDDLEKWIEDEIINLNRNNEFRRFKNQFWFPSVVNIIKKHLDENEEPRIPKQYLCFYYGISSEQIHGNPYLGQNISNPRNQLLALLIILHLRYLKQMSVLTNFPLERAESIIKTWQIYFVNRFFDLWMISKQLTQ